MSLVPIVSVGNFMDVCDRHRYSEKWRAWVMRTLSAASFRLRHWLACCNESSMLRKPCIIFIYQCSIRCYHITWGWIFMTYISLALKESLWEKCPHKAFTVTLPSTARCALTTTFLFINSLDRYFLVTKIGDVMLCFSMFHYKNQLGIRRFIDDLVAHLGYNPVQLASHQLSDRISNPSVEAISPEEETENTDSNRKDSSHSEAHVQSSDKDQTAISTFSVVIFDMSRCSFTDSDGAKCIRNMCESLQSIGKAVMIASCSGDY